MASDVCQTHAPRGRRAATYEEVCWAGASTWACDQVMARAASRPHVAEASHLTIELPHGLVAVRRNATSALVGEVSERRLEVTGAGAEDGTRCGVLCSTTSIVLKF